MVQSNEKIIFHRSQTMAWSFQRLVPVKQTFGVCYRTPAGRPESSWVHWWMTGGASEQVSLTHGVGSVQNGKEMWWETGWSCPGGAEFSCCTHQIQTSFLGLQGSIQTCASDIADTASCRLRSATGAYPTRPPASKTAPPDAVETMLALLHHHVNILVGLGRLSCMVCRHICLTLQT